MLLDTRGAGERAAFPFSVDSLAAASLKDDARHAARLTDRCSRDALPLCHGTGFPATFSASQLGVPSGSAAPSGVAGTCR